MKRITPLPRNVLVPSEAIERLQKKFTDSKSAVERERFWLSVQRKKQRHPLNYDLDPPPV